MRPGCGEPADDVGNGHAYARNLAKAILGDEIGKGRGEREQVLRGPAVGATRIRISAAQCDALAKLGKQCG